jgi:hypothetical protein
MRNKLFLIVETVMLLSCPNINFAQKPDLGTAANFALFTSVGAVGNTGISQVTGDVGTNNGAITSFGNVNGVMHNADPTTAQCVIDLQSAWYQLDTTTATFTHLPVLGNGETLVPGVYALAAAASLETVLTLDAQGDSNAVFIFKIGAAFSTAATSTVNLINGASACNVFWKAEGAISMAALTTMRGTMISHNGAVSTGDGCTLEGRALSTTGSVTIYGTHVYIPCGGSFPDEVVAPNLRSVECFALFSSDGEVSNADVTYVTGAIGTNIGSTTGYNPLLVTGTIHPVPDSKTSQCAVDLMSVYTYLDSLPYDIELLYPASFGNGLVLTPGVYHMSAATTLTDTVYLNAEDNPDGIFVIQIEGALVTSAYSKVSLINGTQAKNVFWKVEGAVTINDYSDFCGTIVCHVGAISLTTGAILNGRALTTTGAVTTIATTANNDGMGTCYALPIKLLSFTAACENQNVVLNWSTDSETNNGYYTIERATNAYNWQIAGTVEGGGNSSTIRNYAFTDKGSYKNVYYRLKQTDFDGKPEYFKVIAIESCRKDLTALDIYPNPVQGTLNLFLKGDKDQSGSVSIYNIAGQRVYHSEAYQSTIDLTRRPEGVYFLRLNLPSKIITKKLVIRN